METFAKHLIEYNSGALSHIRTDIFATTGQHLAYVNPANNQFIIDSGVRNFSTNKYSSSKFANDMIADLKNVDFAGYVDNNGVGIESVITDPVFDAGQIAGGLVSLAAGFLLPLNLGRTLKYFKKGTSKKTKLVGGISLGLLGTSSYFFAYNLINSANLYNSSNLVTSLSGIKGLMYNSGMFLMGLGGYSMLSAAIDYWKDKNKGKAWAKGIFGGLEFGSGLTFTLSSFAPMTSLIYEGANIFSVSTAGLSSILGAPLWGGIGLALTGLFFGAIYLAKWYKERKATKPVTASTAATSSTEDASASATSAAPVVDPPVVPAIPTPPSIYGGDPTFDPWSTTTPATTHAAPPIAKPLPKPIIKPAAKPVSAPPIVTAKPASTPAVVPAVPAKPLAPATPSTPPHVPLPPSAPPSVPAAPPVSTVHSTPPGLMKSAATILTAGPGAPVLKPVPKPLSKPTATKPVFRSAIKPAAAPTVAASKPAAVITPPAKPVIPALLSPITDDDDDDDEEDKKSEEDKRIAKMVLGQQQYIKGIEEARKKMIAASEARKKDAAKSPATP